MAKKYTYQILKQFSPRIYKKSRWEGVGLGCPSVARRRRSRSRRGITPRPARAGRWGSWLPPVNPANEENKCARGRLTATKCDSLISALFIKHTLFRIFTSQFFFNEPWLRPRGWWCCRMRDVAFFYVIIQDTIYHIETLSSELSGLRWSGTLSRKKKLRLK